MSLKGSTKDFPLDVLVRLLADTKKTGELSLRGADGEGALGIADGRVVTAVFADEPPIPALGAIFALGEAEFEFTPWDEAPPANLEGELGELLRKADEYRKWMASVREVIPTDRARFRLSERAAEQGAVTFTSERWRVVLAVNGQRDVNDLATHLHIERDAALTVLAGLVRDRVIETVNTPLPTAPVVEPEPEAPPIEPEAFVAPPPAEPEALVTPPFVEPEPPAAMAVEAPAQEWGAPPPAMPEPVTAEPAVPAEWGAPTPPPEPEAPPPAPPADWGPPAAPPEPEAAPPAPPTEWGAPAPAPEVPAPPPAPEAEWGSSPAAQDWGAPTAAEPPAAEPPAPPPPPLDDRLAALFGTPPSAPAETPPPAADQWSASAADWTAPASADQWTTPAAEPATPAADDPRLGALTMPPFAPAPEAPAPEAPQVPANEWAPPATEAPAPPQKKGGLFGLFRREETAPEPATRTTLVDRSASSRAGLLAAFSNALLTEYNSGHYGKGRVDDRIPNLLMRVDEQADPIDRPLPVVDDRLDVQALERVSPPEMQAVPYLALLVSTIYGDAEKAFGRDRAKRGYKAAQQHVFGGDMSVLSGPDLAGKLPKI